MSGSVNTVTLLGRLGRDPETRTFANGGKVCNLRLATSETWRDKASGERKERTEWHSVVIFNEPLAKVAEQYLRKGSQVYIEGQLETRKWQDQSGQDKYSTEVVLRPYRSTLVLLDGKSEGSGEREPQRQDGHANAGPNGYNGYQAPQSRDLDSDIPF